MPEQFGKTMEVRAIGFVTNSNALVLSHRQQAGDFAPIDPAECPFEPFVQPCCHGLFRRMSGLGLQCVITDLHGKALPR
jgi:hypothetical protein